jgi:adenosine deaminase
VNIESILKNRDKIEIKKVPKADLHAHMILSAPFSAYRDIAGAKIKPPPERFPGGLAEFLEYLRREIFIHLKSLDHFRHLLRATFEHMIEDGVVYTELSYDIHLALIFQVSWDNLVKVISDETNKYSSRLVVRPEFGIPRETDPTIWQTNYPKALGTEYFKSVDLYGAELYTQIETFDSYLSQAKSKGFKIKIHSGEVGPAERILREYELYKPAAIQHGVRAAENSEVMQKLAEAGVTVNVCPWSNYCLQVVNKFKEHPIGKMLRAGMRVTINSDDLSIFGRSLSEEYLALYTEGVLSAEEINIARLNGLAEETRG